MVLFISVCAAVEETSVAPGLIAVTAVCSCASVAVEKFSNRFAAAWSSLDVIVNAVEEPGVVLMDCRNLISASTVGVKVLA
jgi:hypothetical protein